jgi:hypothetical protein
MPDHKQEERNFEQFAAEVEPERSSTLRAPSRLRARIYSALMVKESAQGSLRSVPETKSAGYDLCVFEELVRIAPIGDKYKSLNFCRACHARWLAEMMDQPPIYWGGCPYVKLKKS